MCRERLGRGMGERWESTGWFGGKSSQVRVVPRSYLPSHTHRLTGFHVSSQSIPQPPHHPPQRYSATQAAQSHLLHTSPGAFPPSHARPAHTAHTCEGARRKKKKKKSSGKPPALPRPLQHAPLPPPPSTFEKCLQKGEYFLSLVSTWPTQPGQSLPARAGVPSPLCSAVPARLCPQTSIVHYRR